MSTAYGVKAVTVGVPTIFTVTNLNISCAIVANESPYTLRCSVDGTGSTKTINALTIERIDIPPNGAGFTGNLVFNPVAVLTNTANAPSYAILVDTYGSSEDPGGTYPVALARAVNVGNQIVTNMGGSTNLQNDNNVAGTQIIEATQAASPQSNVLILNNGTITIQEYISGLITALVQVVPGASTAIKLAAVGRMLEVLGNLTVDGATTLTGAVTAGSMTVNGATTLTGAVTATNASNNLLASSANVLNGGANLPGGNLGESADGDLLAYNGTNLRLKSNGGVLATIAGVDKLNINAGGLFLTDGKIGQSSSGDIIDASGTDTFVKGGAGGAFKYQAPNGTTTWTRSAESHGSVAVNSGATGTITHNLKVNGVSVTPDTLEVTPVNAATSTATWTALNLGSTTFQIFNSASGVNQTFHWHCIKY